MEARTLKPSRTRKSRTHRFCIGEQALKGYLVVGFTDDDKVCEIFIYTSKTGTTIQGVFDSLALMVSNALQYGMPLEKVVRSLKEVRYEPLGMTGDPDVPSCSSVSDYIAKRLETYL